MLVDIGNSLKSRVHVRVGVSLSVRVSATMAVWSCGAKPVVLCYCIGPFGFTVVARVRVWVRIEVSVKIRVRVRVVG